MSRLATPAVADAPEGSKPLLEATQHKLGVVPNLYRVIGNSPHALEAYLAFAGALQKTLDAQMQQRIALAVAQIDGCDYCLSAHSFLAAKLAKLSPDEIAANRKGTSTDAKADPAVRFAAKVAELRGHVSDADIAAVKLAGYDDAQIVEIVGLVAENVFTNFLNSVARTEIDFPVVKAEAA